MSRTPSHVSWITALAGLIGAAYLAYTGWISGSVWQLYALAGASTILALAGLLAAGLAHGRPRAAAWILIVAHQAVFVTAAALIAGLGFACLVSLVVLTLLVAAITLPARQAPSSLYLALACGVGAALLDWFKPIIQYSLSTQVNIILGIFVISLGLAHAAMLARSFRSFSLRAQLISIFILISALSLTAAITVANLTTRRQLTAEANTRLLSAAAQTAQRVDNFIQSNRQAVYAESRLPVMAQYLTLSPTTRSGSQLSTQLSQTLWALLQKDPLNIASYALLDKQGMNVADNVAEDIGQLEYSRDYFILPLQSAEPYVSPVEFSRTSDETVIYFSAPVLSASGEALGVLRVRYRAAVLQDFIAENNDLAGPDSFAFLVDEQHLRLAHGLDASMILQSIVALNEDQWVRLTEESRLPVRSRLELSTDLPGLEAALVNASNQPFYTGQTGGKIPSLTGEAAVQQVAIVNLQSRPWQVVFALPRVRLLAPIQAQTRNTTLLGLLIAGGVTLAGLALARVLTAPIANLTEAARRVAAGDFSARAEVPPGNEMSDLASTFNSMTSQLRMTLEDLEQRVAQRTRQLEKRALQLRASAEVGSAVASLRVLDELLPQVTHLISERFGYYHTGIFLLDASSEYAVLHAANSPGGERMIARGHRLKVGETGIVGYAAANKEARIALDVGQDDVYYDNPDLPETRAEMALPLAVGGEVLGVLDVQSQTPGAFTDEDVTILQVLADQVAVAIENARLFSENQAALESARRAYGELSHEAWERMLQKRGSIGYLASRQDALYPAAQSWTPEMQQASRAGETVQSEDGNLSIPIKDRESILGVLRLRKPAGQAWSQQELALAESLAEQLFLALESARLFQETQARAERERLAGEITAKLRASNDPQTILQTAIQELRQALASSSQARVSNLPAAGERFNEDTSAH